MYENLTSYLTKFDDGEFGTWITNIKDDGVPQIPFVDYSETVNQFVHEVYAYVNEHRELQNYSDILETNGLKWEVESMKDADVSKLDAECVLALILGAIRAARFSEGALLRFFKDGSITRWLERLKELDS